MKPADIGAFDIEFSPEKRGKFMGEIHLHIKNNVYEKFVIHLIGETSR